jgi:hypothetical protein
MFKRLSKLFTNTLPDALELVGRAMEGALTMARAGLNRAQGTPDSNQNTLLDQLFGNHNGGGSIKRVNGKLPVKYSWHKKLIPRRGVWR